jgi:hypothetical protein
MNEQEIALNAEGDRAGAELGLGERTGAWSARRHSGRWGCGLALIIAMTTVCWIPLMPFMSGLSRVITGAIIGGFAVLAVRLMSDPQAHWWDRMYLYTGGVVQFTDRQPEPAVLRWADLEQLSIRVDTGYESDVLSSCELGDRAGTAMTVHVSRFGDACAKVIAAAGHLLAGQRAGELIARFDAGEMITFGDMSIDQVGIRVHREGGKARAWWVAWRDASAIDMTFWAHRLTITPRKGAARSVKLGGEPNDILAWYFIAHVASRAGVAVTGDVPDLSLAGQPGPELASPRPAARREPPGGQPATS